VNWTEGMVLGAAAPVFPLQLSNSESAFGDRFDPNQGAPHWLDADGSDE